MAHHVVDEVRRSVAVPGDIGLHLGADRVSDRGLVVPEALADIAALRQPGVRQPQRTQPFLRLGALPRQVVLADIVGVGELLDVEQIAPLLPADDGKPLTVVGNAKIRKRHEGAVHLVSGKPGCVGADDVLRDANLFDDLHVCLAPERVGTRLGDNLLLVDVGFHLIQPVDPITGIGVDQQARRRRKPVLSLADRMECRLVTRDTVFRAHGVAQLRAHLLVLEMDFSFEVLDERTFGRDPIWHRGYSLTVTVLSLLSFIPNSRSLFRSALRVENKDRDPNFCLTALDPRICSTHHCPVRGSVSAMNFMASP